MSKIKVVKSKQCLDAVADAVMKQPARQSLNPILVGIYSALLDIRDILNVKDETDEERHPLYYKKPQEGFIPMNPMNNDFAKKTTKKKN